MGEHHESATANAGRGLSRQLLVDADEALILLGNLRHTAEHGDGWARERAASLLGAAWSAYREALEAVRRAAGAELEASLGLLPEVAVEGKVFDHGGWRGSGR